MLQSDGLEAATPHWTNSDRENVLLGAQSSKAAVDPYRIFKTIKISALTEISRIAKCRRLEKASFKGHTQEVREGKF